MTAAPLTTGGVGRLPRRGAAQGGLRLAFGRTRLVERIAIGAVGLVFLVALLAPLLAPFSPTVPSGVPFLAPGGAHWFGTDEVGYDILSRVVYGIRSTWLAALLVIGSGVLIGGVVGLVAGSVGGWVDGVLMRITDGFLALPGPVLAIAVVAALGPSLTHTLVAVIIVWWPFYARIVRTEVRSWAARPHLEAARLAGVRWPRRVVRHLLPGALPATLVTATLDVGNLVLILASLSFLGLGSPAPTPELGAMAARGLPYLLEQWWVPVLPGLAVLGLAFATNVAGDGFADMLDSH